MSNPPTNVKDGWNRYYVKSSGALTRDISVFSDEAHKDQLYKVDGKMFGRDAAVIDSLGNVVLKAKTKKIVPMNVEYVDTDGNLVAELEADSPLKKKYMAINLTSGDEWVLEGEKAKKAYTILEGEKPVIHMDLKSLLLHKEFTVDIADGVDIPLAVGVAWALNLAVLQRVAATGGAIAAT